MTNILVIGANGQLGSELTTKLRNIYGNDHVIASDKYAPAALLTQEPFVQLDVMNKSQLYEVVRKFNISEIYHLAAILSAKGEENPQMAWELNMQSLLFVLELAREKVVSKVYWPSSIAVFGADTPKVDTPQMTIMNPTTVYGISKLAGERWCAYYHQKHGVDVRSLRYPGLIGYKTQPGGGTTDYAVDIFFKAVKGESFTCFLSEDTRLPMMYMDDAVRATVELMTADPAQIKVRSSYNLAGMSFTPREITSVIQTYFPDFSPEYAPDYRQAIADSWPQTIDDSAARSDWGWKEEFQLEAMAEDIISHLKPVLQ